MGKVENLTGAKALNCGSLRDMYIWFEGELDTARKDNCVGEGSELFQCVAPSPLNMAEGSIRPASVWALAGSSIKLSLKDILLSVFCSVELVSVLRTTVLEVVVVEEACCCSICCFFFNS